MDKEKKYAVSLSKQDLNTLAHILRHFSDYVGMDDRPDHGIGILSGYRDISRDRKIELYQLSAKINRAYRRTWEKYNPQEDEIRES